MRAGLAPTSARAYQALREASASGDAMASDNGREVGEKRRRDRLAASLRENLKRRKVQQKGRARENGSAEHEAADSRVALEPSPTAPGERGA